MAAQKLISNLANLTISENLLRHYLPVQYLLFRRGLIDASPMSLVQSEIREVIGGYGAACRA
ncbi:class II D-tagatose-bisphosphate aldolase non-catalytic subunit [Pararobbsia alpina]|uniref:Uncharacterized protein n=1 Tax=Pararobbsia alpina TaxID=621374 RepID=A0A6S7BE38_9BURK|nr:class II D-tagatose-bisphosphate aldolase, non-catalytic subunit [Pararobbsia alpina]CAB3797231.1 hypothetical protein LMG28138_04215 [Pararobbsia alpina]